VDVDSPFNMVGEKPTAGYVISLLGGIFVILGGLFFIIAGATIDYYPFGLPDYSYLICSPIGILIGLIIVIAASRAYYNPEAGPKLGSVIIILSIVSWVFALGGLIIGSLFGFIGGILLIAWKPPKPIGPKEIIIREREIVRIPCQYCNQLVDIGAIKCPYCGAAPR